MAKSERLQIQKLRNYSAPDEQNFALVLFEDEERYSVIEVDQIKEKHYGYNQIINVLWGKGKEAKYFTAKLLQCGTKEECEKASLDLSFSQDTCATASDKESDREEPHPTLKRKRDGEILLTKNKKGTDHACKSADASWKASIEEEQRRLDSVLNGSQTKERFQRSPLTSKLASTSGEHFQRSHPQSEHVMVEVEPRLDLSAILSRLDKIEGKLDTLLHRHSSKFVPVTPPISRSGSPLPVVVKESNHGAINISEEESEDSAIVYNDIDLLALKAPPKEPTRYATRIAGVVFSKEELLGGMIPPLNDKYARTPLDPERIEIMRKCIAKKYTQKILEKMWGDIRRAVNQKCNDLRKKSKE